MDKTLEAIILAMHGSAITKLERILPAQQSAAHVLFYSPSTDEYADMYLSRHCPRSRSY